MVKYRTWTASLKLCIPVVTFPNSAELRYFYLVKVANSVPNIICLHPKDLWGKRKKLLKYDSFWKNKNSKSLTDSGTI